MTRLFAGTEFDIPPRCDRCGKLDEECECPEVVTQVERMAPEKQTAKVRVDRRKHKRMVTVVWGLEEPATDLAGLLSKLKSACGAGGAVKDGELELQGDHLDRIKSTLKEIGYRVR